MMVNLGGGQKICEHVGGLTIVSAKKKKKWGSVASRVLLILHLAVPRRPEKKTHKQALTRRKANGDPWGAQKRELGSSRVKNEDEEA